MQIWWISAARALGCCALELLLRPFWAARSLPAEAIQGLQRTYIARREPTLESRGKDFNIRGASPFHFHSLLGIRPEPNVDTYSCPTISSPYPAGRLTSVLNIISTEAYLRACLLRSTAALYMSNAQPRCILWACRSFNIPTPHLEQYVNNGGGPDGILKRVMTESNLSNEDAKKRCIKTWTDTPPH